MIVLGVVYSPGCARLVRAQVLSLREELYVPAASSMSASPARIRAFHILPNEINPVIVLASLSTAGAILAEAGLRFLGVGVQPPTPSGSPAENNAQPTVLSPRASLHRTASLLRG